MKIKTTVKKLRDGVKMSSGDQVEWESTGHLSVRLLDSSGTVPLALRQVTFQVPGEGAVEQASDDEGRLFHADVPFQDYELDLGSGVKVHAAAVANRDEVLERYVYEVQLAFANLQVREADGTPVGPGTLTLASADKTLEKEVDEHGMLEGDEPVPVAEYRLTLESGGKTYRGTLSLDNRKRQLVIATVHEEST